ncbi:single-stranded DNA-binding protein [Deinococcus wulumuqiensis]|uniref:Single-stranded DNA-binding protein n=1 Tax=Deinococcus wulumuqiensis TaxID=980427 RepID=A0A345IKD5_9DEIO|nr:single-stranded DNA-binding protein [Deinococcus wulumuqiensis]
MREALQSSMTTWATVEVRGDQARVIPAPELEPLIAGLDRLAPQWSLHWACDATSPYVVRARLDVAGVSREGLAQAPTLPDAKLAALAELARLFGISGGEGQWVDYDPEDGANVADLDAERELPAAPRPVTLPPEPPRDPQMEKARRHIDDLLEQLKAAGKSGEAARILMRGYGETVDESRALYKQLKAILDQ